jgi:hypothetical protein
MGSVSVGVDTFLPLARRPPAGLGFVVIAYPTVQFSLALPLQV